jgi:hypothetical protein
MEQTKHSISYRYYPKLDFIFMRLLARAITKNNSRAAVCLKAFLC